MKRIIVCLLAFACVFTNVFAADIVTGLTQNEEDKITVIDGIVSEYGEADFSEDEIFELAEYANGITITAPASTITKAGGTLQLTATIDDPAEGESVIWSIESGNNCATINQNGVVTAVTNGTVVCKVHSTKDATKIAYKTIVIFIKTETRLVSVDLMGVKCKIDRIADGKDISSTSYETRSFAEGTHFVMTAVPKSNSEFAYWKDENGRIISYDPMIEFILSTEVKLTAVCATSGSASYLVTFRDIGGKVEAEGYTTSQIKVPARPFTTGYTFACWLADGNQYNFVPGSVLDASSITKHTMFSAGYIKDATEYTVTVTGADSNGGKYTYNRLITLNPAAPEEGKRFAYWKRDGKIVCHDETYKFYVGASDTTIEAVFVDINEPVAEAPIIVIAEPQVVDGNKISFAAERCLPEQYTVLSTGIILSKSTQNVTLENATINAQATSTANKGQYTVRKKDVTSSETWYARAYVIYKDGENIITMYSDVVSKKLK